MYRFKFLRIDIFLISLILISVILCYQNYTPNTILSGWDTIHPEFNFFQYFQRITSVWQEQQGLGAPAAQAHASEIPRMVIYGLLMLIFPLDFVRYSYIFLMMIIGPVGVYLLILYFLKKDQSNNFFLGKISAFLGGLFYLLNLGTMQHFIVVLEMFATKFGFLGFLYLFATKFLDTGRKKHLFILLLFVLFSASMAHTATLWYVFYFGLILYVITYALFHAATRHILFKRGRILLLFILIINFFWLLPNIYYSFNYGQDVINSKIHRLFTDEAYLNNKDYGSIDDFLLFRNFLFNWRVQDGVNSSTDLMLPWKLHLQNISITVVGYILSALSLVGIVFAIKKKHVGLISLLPISIIAGIFLLSNVPVLSQISDLLRYKSDFFKEAFRFPFTKLSIYLIFSFAIFFAFANFIILKKITKRFAGRILRLLVIIYVCFLGGCIIIFSWPAFTGNYISHVIKVKIPQDYFELFAWSKHAKEGRMLELPMYKLYGWQVYSWEKDIYQGAGFAWFGLKQSLLDREFDRWYQYNEQSYRELSYALYSQDATLFENLLQKYNITYLLVDQNIVNPGEAPSQKIVISDIENLLLKIPRVHVVRHFGSKITIYEFFTQNKQNEVFLLEKPKNILPTYRLGYIDQAYIDYGDYISSDYLDPELFQKVFYPTRDIFTNKERINTNALSLNTMLYRLELSQKGTNKVTTPDINKIEKNIFTNIYVKKQSNGIIVQLYYQLPQLEKENDLMQEFVLPESSDGNIMFAINDKVINLSQKLLTDKQFFVGETIVSTQKENTIKIYEKQQAKILPFNPIQIYPYACSEQKANQIFGGEITENNSLSLYAKNIKVCSDIKLIETLDNALLNDGLLNLNFTYHIQSNTVGSACFYDGLTKICNSDRDLASFSDEDKHASIFTPIDKNNLENLFLKFSLDAQDDNELKTLSIKNIQPILYQEASHFTFFPNVPNVDRQTSRSFSLIGRFPQERINIKEGNLLEDIKDCSLTKAKFIEKKIINGVLEYKSINGALCDGFLLPSLSQQTGYIIALNSQNIQGLPIRICLQDELTKKCLIEDELSRNHEFGTDYFLLPPYNIPGVYKLKLTNFSIGDIAAFNKIGEINIIPFPYSYLQGISVKRENVSNEKSNLEPLEFNRYAPYYYSLTITSKNLKNNPVIVLNQAFEKNWKAYFVPSWTVTNPIFRIFITIFGRELKNHILVNNWTNGWMIDSKDFQNEGSSLTIALIFLPQWLEYFGFVVLAFSFVIILSRVWQKK